MVNSLFPKVFSSPGANRLPYTTADKRYHAKHVAVLVIKWRFYDQALYCTICSTTKILPYNSHAENNVNIFFPDSLPTRFSLQPTCAHHRWVILSLFIIRLAEYKPDVCIGACLRVFLFFFFFGKSILISRGKICLWIPEVSALLTTPESVCSQVRTDGTGGTKSVRGDEGLIRNDLAFLRYGFMSGRPSRKTKTKIERPEPLERLREYETYVSRIWYRDNSLDRTGSKTLHWALFYFFRNCI